MAERLYASKAGDIDPVALVNETVAIWLKARWHMYRVTYIEPMPKSANLIFDQGALAALAQTGDVRLNNLDQQSTPSGMIQLRFYPLDDIRVEFKIGRSESRFAAANVLAQADRFTIINDPCLHTTEVFILEDNSAYVNCTNPTAYATAMSRVQFFGFRYMMKDYDKDFATPEEVKQNYPNVVFVPSGSD
jgi:hypothetical protein